MIDVNIIFEKILIKCVISNKTYLFKNNSEHLFYNLIYISLKISYFFFVWYL